MLGLNAARCYGFDLDALRPIADEIGPLVADVDEPLAATKSSARGGEVPSARRLRQAPAARKEIAMARDPVRRPVARRAAQP